MIIYQYPKSENLKDGSLITIRPLRKEDEKILHEYFLRLPPEDRMCLKDDVTDPKVIENWIYNLDYDVVLPLVALDVDHIVANGTLQFDPVGWTKHQGENPHHLRSGVQKKRAGNDSHRKFDAERRRFWFGTTHGRVSSSLGRSLFSV